MRKEEKKVDPRSGVMLVGAVRKAETCTLRGWV
jgi:hypothetical protein